MEIEQQKRKGKKRKAEENNNEENGFKTPSKKFKEPVSVFIGGLSFSTDEDGLKKCLEEYEVEVTSVRIISRDGQSKGFGYADFESKDDAQKLIDLTEQIELDGRTLRFDVASHRPNSASAGRGSGRGRGGFGSGGRGGFGSGGRGGRGGRGGGSAGRFDNETPTKLLMVKNLSFHTDNSSLASAFSTANDARVVMDKETRKSRGFAFVEFDDVETAKKARDEMNGQDLDGRNVNIVFATPRANFGGGGRGRGSSGRGGRGGRGGGRGGRGGAPASNKGTIQRFEGSKLTFDDDSD